MHTIEDTILSVLNQRYDNLEYILVDGLSTDGTVEIVKKYIPKISKFISEIDNGIYDAMNKGISHATGDIIGFLNSDDVYNSNNIISSVVDSFRENNTDSVFGDLVYVSRNNINKVRRHWCSLSSNKYSFQHGWHPPHPALFIKREVFTKYGTFDLDFDLAADFDLMLRFFEFYKISFFYLPNILVKMRLGGESNKSLINVLKQNYEILKSFKKYNISIFPPFYFFRRLYPKTLNYLKLNIFS